MLKRVGAGVTALLVLAAADRAPPMLQDSAAAFGARQGIEHLSLSPDGTRLAYVMPLAGQASAVMTVGVAPGSKPAMALHVGGNPERVERCRWVATDRLACLLVGVGHYYNKVASASEYVAVNVDGTNLREIPGGIVDWLPGEDGNVLTCCYNGLAHLDTRTLVQYSVDPLRPGTNRAFTDGRGKLRVMGIERVRGTGMQKGAIGFYYRRKDMREWLPLSEFDFVNETGFRPVAVDPLLDAVYGMEKIEGRWAVARMSIDGSGKRQVVFARPDVDVDHIVLLGRSARVVGAAYATEKPEIAYFDPDVAKLAASLGKALPKQPIVHMLDASTDGNRLLIWAGSDDDPGVYYVYDRTTRELATFQPVRPRLEGTMLAHMKPVSYRAADGTMIPAYLTLPPGKEDARDLPAIVMPHGGPAARDEWGFDWMSQYFATRGFAVIQPNFRGSAGYGDEWFEKNGFQSWRIAIGDVTDAGRWLVSQGIADPKRLAIFGWSYGGYAALQSAVVDPDLFKAVVAVAPVTDFASLKNESRGWSNYNIVKDFIGAGPHIVEGSPAQNAARIKVPVLMFHGELDGNVGITESRLMASKLAAAAVPHELVTYPKLDHQLEDSVVRADLLRKSDAFIRKAIGM